MSVDCDAKLTELAAGVLRDAVQVYDPVSALNTVLFARNMTMLGGFDATGSFPAVTGSFPVLTGSFRAITGSFAVAGLDAAAEPAVTLKRVFKLPSRLPGIQLPSESELASVARSAPVIGVLAALASWLGQDGRPVTDAGDLADDDAADACGQLGIRPEQMSSLWAYALISGWLELEDSADRRQTWALTGPAARRWADGDDSGTLHGWAAVFAAVAGSVGPYGRLAAVDIARRVGAPGYRAWKDAVKRLELRGYAVTREHPCP